MRRAGRRRSAYLYPGRRGRPFCGFQTHAFSVRTKIRENGLERFYRGDSARTQKSGGYGIGLSAASAIVRLHKGSVKAEYEDGRVVFHRRTAPVIKRGRISQFCCGSAAAICRDLFSRRSVPEKRFFSFTVSSLYLLFLFRLL